MPAVTVDNPLTLPRSPTADPAPRVRPVTSVTTAPPGLEGEGFPVRRAFAGVADGRSRPFVHMDQMGEVGVRPGEPKGTPWHPHRGFETVTYMIDGTFQHQDSIGGGGLITNGATQWMTAGAGILHIERPPDDLIASGGLFHGIQLWVNLPAADKWVAPATRTSRPRPRPCSRRPTAARLVRVVAGAGGRPRRARASPTPRSPWSTPPEPGGQAGAALAGRVQRPGLRAGRPGTVGPDAPAHRRPASWPCTARATPRVTADAVQESRHPNLDVLVLGGRPIGEPVAVYGPFVMNTKDELAQAFEDFHAGKLGTIPADHIGD